MQVVASPETAAASSKLRQLATHDFFPELSATVRRVFYNPFGILLAAVVASLICGLFLHPQGYVLAASLGTVLLIGVLFPWISLRGLSTKLHFSQTHGSEQQPILVRLHINNRWPWGAWGLAIRHGFHQGDSPAASISHLASRMNGSCQWEFTPTQRGVYPTLTPCITTGFPFGLWEAAKTIPVQQRLVVWPKTFPVGPIPTSHDETSTCGSVPRNKAGTHGDLMGVRPYRRGDSLSRIHWAQSAKHDQLIVCERQATARPVFQIVLDVDPKSHAGSGSNSSREWAIRIAASLAKGWLQEGVQVGMAWANQQFAPASGERQCQQLLDGLAAIPEVVDESLNHLLNCPVCRSPRDVLQIVITTECGAQSLTKSINDQRRFIIIHEQGFSAAGSEQQAPTGLGIRPWLWIPSAERVPELLRTGWEEARHGS